MVKNPVKGGKYWFIRNGRPVCVIVDDTYQWTQKGSECKHPPLPARVFTKVTGHTDKGNRIKPRITNLLFDNTAYFRFRDVAAAAGITIPITPGIFPVQNFKQTANFARRSGASVPQWLADRFEGLEDDAATRRLVAAAVCAEQVLDLIDHGVGELHFYTMNRADLVFAICHLIGVKPKAKVEAEAA